jgi:glutathione S-transferase
MAGMTVYHIPVCPFCQRLEILLELKGLRDQVLFEVIDISEPRPAWLTEKTRGSTALPVLETEDGGVIKESLVILQYLEEVFPEPRISQRDPYRHAVENMLFRLEGPFTHAGYSYVMNQDITRRGALRDSMLGLYAQLDEFLLQHASAGPFLFERFGMAETVFTPLFMRFWFLEYYEGFELPDDPRYARVGAWRDACLAHPAAQQTCREEVVKLYYDYAMGAGNGALLPGRKRSSFAFEPDWRMRPWPPKAKYGARATDAELGL